MFCLPFTKTGYDTARPDVYCLRQWKFTIHSISLKTDEHLIATLTTLTSEEDRYILEDTVKMSQRSLHLMKILLLLES